MALAHPDGSLDVLSSPLEAETAHVAAKHDPDVRVHVVGREETETELKQLLPGEPKIGLNFRELTHDWYVRLEKLLPEAEWTDVSNAIKLARVTKDPHEIQMLRKAGEIGSKVALEIPSLFKEGMTELQLAAEMEFPNGSTRSQRSFLQHDRSLRSPQRRASLCPRRHALEGRGFGRLRLRGASIGGMPATSPVRSTLAAAMTR